MNFIEKFYRGLKIHHKIENYYTFPPKQKEKIIMELFDELGTKEFLKCANEDSVLKFDIAYFCRYGKIPTFKEFLAVAKDEAAYDNLYTIKVK